MSVREYVEFKGLKHYATGDVQLRFDEDQSLIVEGLNNLPDTLTIDTNGAEAWKLLLKPITLDTETFISSTFNQIDDRKQLKTLAQWFIMQSPDGKHAYVMVNSKLEGRQLILEGRKDGQNIFSQVYDTSNRHPTTWIVIAIFTITASPVLLRTLTYETEIERDRQNKIIRITAIKSFGCGGFVSPAASNVTSNTILPKKQNEIYEVDHLYITSIFEYPHGLETASEKQISQVTLTGRSTPLVLMNEWYY